MWMGQLWIVAELPLNIAIAASVNAALDRLSRLMHYGDPRCSLWQVCDWLLYDCCLYCECWFIQAAAASYIVIWLCQMYRSFTYILMLYSVCYFIHIQILRIHCYVLKYILSGQQIVLLCHLSYLENCVAYIIHAICFNMYIVSREIPKTTSLTH